VFKPALASRWAAPKPGVEHALHRRADALLAEAWTWHIAPGKKPWRMRPAAKLRIGSANRLSVGLCEVRVFKPIAVISELVNAAIYEFEGVGCEGGISATSAPLRIQ
jgi:hypothetical protein